LTLDLHGRVALVTGGGTGIGREISRQLALRGANLMLSYARSEADAASAAAELAHHGVRTATHRADVRSVADCDALVQATIETFGRIDVLVNNAGVTRFIPFPDLAAVTEEVWDDIFGVNLKGAFFVARAAGIWMRHHGDGAAVIVNISSTAGLTTRGSSLPYAVSKSALLHTTQTLAAALAPRVRVNAVAPSSVFTRWWTGLEDALQRTVEKDFRFGRAITVEEVADAVLLLITNEGMSGQTIVVDAANIMH
jgi:3-oxoacyl-[acyl-carrier protein] reductase